MPRPLCTDENQRLAKLLSYNILDTESELAYDDITCLVKQICNVPIALISLVDRDRQWFKSIQGLEASQTSREVSFCTRTIQQTEVMVVPDAAQDPRFADNPLVTGEPYIRFYAGAPLVTSDGFALGSLCAIDTQPRTFSEEQRQSLVALSRLTLNQLELRRTLQLRQQAEEKLIVQQTEFEQLISKAPGMLFQSRRDPDGHLSFPYVSDRASELFGGLTPAEIRADAKAVGNLVKPEFKAEWRQMIATSVETLKNLDCTVPMVDRRGHEKWIKVHTTAEQSPDGSVLWHGVMTDVTERRNIEAKAAATQQLLQLILDTVPQGILWKDRNLVFQGCNRQLADMLGLDSPEQIIGKTDFEIQDSPEQAEWYRSCDRRVIESGQPQLGMIETLTVNGNTIWLNTSRLPIQNDAGEVERILITIEDITPLKQAQQQAADQAAELQQTLQTLRQTQTKIVQAEKMSGLAQLVAGVAHEINNPVGFISGNIAHAQSYIADLLSLIDTYQLHHSSLLSAALAAVEAERAELDIDFVRKDLPHLLTSMKAGTRRIITIVESLCTFSRLNEASFKDIDIHQSLDSSLTLLQHRLRDQLTRGAIEIVRHYGELPRVDCYAGQLNQVFMHLLTNAIDAIDDYGPATPKIRLETCQIDDQTIQISIIDNGGGIANNLRDRIFNPFFTTKSVGKGTGMGLSISYQIITDTHGGSLTCDSATGQGSTFTIQLPLCLRFDPAKTGALSQLV